MKIIHTSDWHIGKVINERSLLADQEEVLTAWISQVAEMEADLVIIAGDLYDRSLPNRESVHLCNQLLTQMSEEISCPICIISGNHDSGERIDYASAILEKEGLYLEGMVKKAIRCVRLEEADVYLLPYSDYGQVQKLYPDQSIRSMEDALRVQIQTIKSGDWRPDRLNLLVFHGYVTNVDLEEAGADLEHTESERPLSMGNSAYVPADLLADFDYVALGHLHGRQYVKNQHIYYSGSPLKYSKSEARQRKVFLEVDLTKESLRVIPHPIQAKHDLRRVKASFEELMAGQSDDYLYVELTDSQPIHEAMSRLRQVYPHIMALSYTALEVDQPGPDTSYQAKPKEDLDQVFATFYEDQTGQTLTAYQKQLVSKILAETRERGEEEVAK
ncbi:MULTISPECIES: exonuclease SbcCD subunit D [Aerococcus]|uniref:Nuclease SbcCD subunit D n=1 Tax=Aerococcus sanguinicola TaxID=119206 RepID=A0A5N1GMS3_9LACT|nr:MULTISPECIES: exonuclease SbcCD subunit D [Aerococcus]KAA9302275.1 exonuclease SbcCD subunit D [Aerococcus sanguinicola]MDK6369029.1 exonuclease SbcCD subunit D [Aerococcus sp. UMB9870]MDK6678931.1 exonuclease SbcCD subunit D [Aerococcus sp. UMB8608]MDK6686522.1 exonuclease SbcCD subunit D [Aerococcus sp. UMB8623]MDK6939590.1 exonuclease SbcCD subunit D [Aerococcus sp. UMB8487]